jgi:hypothetical protein
MKISNLVLTASILLAVSGAVCLAVPQSKGPANGEAKGQPEGHPKGRKSKREVIESLYKLQTFPFNVPYLQNQSDYPRDIFHPNVIGRTTPLRMLLEGDVMNIEYWVGLNTEDENALQNRGAYFRGYVEQGDTAATIVDVTISGSGIPAVKLTSMTFWKFDKNNLITEYDLELANLDGFYKSQGIDFTDPSLVKGFIVSSICAQHDTHCIGDNNQYPSPGPSCSEFLGAESMKFGTPGIGWSNTVVCRNTHALMVKLRPGVHCSHIGPNGGGQCIDSPYGYFDETTSAHFHPFIGKP